MLRLRRMPKKYSHNEILDFVRKHEMSLHREYMLEAYYKNNNDINTFINKTYKGNCFSGNGDILLEIFDTNNFYASEIMEDITIKLNYKHGKIHALITLNDEIINLIYDDYLNLV